MQPLDRFAANDDVARLMHSTAESVVRSDLDENGGEPAETRLESWPETDRIMARGYTPGNQG